MAENVTLYHGSNGRYYTAEGLADYMSYGVPSASFTYQEREAVKYTVRVSLMDPTAGVLYCASGDGVSSFSRTENGRFARYYNNDGAGPSVSIDWYKYNGSWVTVYGSHPAHPGMCMMTSSVRVNFTPSSSARYKFNGAMTHELGNFATRAVNVASGTEYDADKIVYRNSSGSIWLGRNVALDKSYAVYAGYYWFCAFANGNATPETSLNANTRTVENGKKRALVTDLDGYVSSVASATVKSSTGSLTFAYRQLFRQNLGDYEPESSSRRILPATGVDSVTGSAIVLRGVDTRADGTGRRFPVGSDIADVLTRRPSLETYDTRVSLYTIWSHRIDVSIDNQGGTSDESVIYYSTEDEQFYSDGGMETVLTRIQAPSKANAVFLGYYTATEGGVLAVSRDGEIQESFTPQSACTVYARWRTVVDVALELDGGSGGASALAYDSERGGFTVDGGDVSVQSIDVPVRPMFDFGGFYDASSGGTQCVGSDGALLSAFTSLGSACPTTLYARWSRRSYGMTIDAQGGDSGTPSVYCNGVDQVFYSDDRLENDTEYIETPVRTGYEFCGCFDSIEGGTEVIDQDGLIVCGVFSSDVTVYARWQAKTYVVTFDYSGGSGSVETKTVTFGEPIGNLPSVTPPDPEYTFLGWVLGNDVVTSQTVWDRDGDETLSVSWYTSFGLLKDYFGLSGNLLVCIGSSDGATRNVVESGHGGRLAIQSGDSAIGAHRVYGKIMNPSNTYRVIGRGKIVLTMGKAYGMATISGSVTDGGVRHPVATRSGYMLTGWKYKTSADGIPLLEVRGTGNEGYVCSSSGQTATARLTDAINRYSVTLNLDPDHVAQDPCGAISGGGELVSCETEGVCDPVVPVEWGMPCASDVCHGKVVVHATKAAYHGESEPSAVSPFEETKPTESCEENDYTTYGIVAERSIA